MRNLSILHSAGELVIARNYSGTPLNLRFLAGFATTVPVLCRSLLNDDVQQVICGDSLIVFRLCGKYVFVAHDSSAKVAPALDPILGNIIDVLQFLYGPPDTWQLTAASVEGIEYIIDTLAQEHMLPPHLSTQGILRYHPHSEVRLRIDRLLMSLESMPGFCNRATMLICGDTIVHSRFDSETTRKLILFDTIQPMQQASVTWDVVYVGDSWFQMVRSRFSVFKLLALCYSDSVVPNIEVAENCPTPVDPGAMRRKLLSTEQLDSTEARQGRSMVQSASAGSHTMIPPLSAVPIPTILAVLAEFHMAFAATKMDLPTSMAPVLLRQVAPREVLLMQLQRLSTHEVVFPVPRPATEAQQDAAAAALQKFRAAALSAAADLSVYELIISEGSFRYAAIGTGDVNLQVLFSAETISSDQVSSMATHLMNNARALLGPDTTT